MSSFNSSPLLLSINWSNKTGFDNVKRLRFQHIFNNTADDTIFDRKQHGIFFQNNAKNLSFSYLIERKMSNVGKHSFKIFYSFLSEGDTWFNLLGGKTLVAQITQDHIGTNFDSIKGQKLLLKPDFEDTSGFKVDVLGEVFKYTIVNNHSDIFGFGVEFVLSGEGFYIRKDGKYMSVDQNGHIKFTQTLEDAQKFYRVSMSKPNETVINGIATSTDAGKALFLFRDTIESEPIFKSLVYVLDYSKINMEVYETSLRDQGKTPTDDDYLNKTLVVLHTFTASVSRLKLLKCDPRRMSPISRPNMNDCESELFDYTVEIIPKDEKSFYIKNENDNKYMTVDGVGLMDFTEKLEMATPFYRCELKLENDETIKVISTSSDIYNAFLLTMKHVDQQPIRFSANSYTIPPPKIEIGFKRIHIIDYYYDTNIVIANLEEFEMSKDPVHGTINAENIKVMGSTLKDVHALDTATLYKCVNDCKNNDDCLGIRLSKSRNTSPCIEHRRAGTGNFAPSNFHKNPGGVDIENMGSEDFTVFKKVRLEY